MRSVGCHYRGCWRVLVMIRQSVDAEVGWEEEGSGKRTSAEGVGRAAAIARAPLPLETEQITVAATAVVQDGVSQE